MQSSLDQSVRVTSSSGCLFERAGRTTAELKEVDLLRHNRLVIKILILTQVHHSPQANQCNYENIGKWW